MRDVYYGRYARFDTASKRDAARLLGADSLVGDLFEIEFHAEGDPDAERPSAEGLHAGIPRADEPAVEGPGAGEPPAGEPYAGESPAAGLRVAWLKNRFGALVGFFDPTTSHQLSLCEERGWKLHALLSFVAYSEKPEPGRYWGEAALVCYDAADPAERASFDAFVEGIARQMAAGSRPGVELGEREVEGLLESGGAWSPAQSVPFPGKEPGTVLLKTHRSLTEKITEQARKGNKGCSLASWLLLLVALAGVVFGLRACGVF
ncbi:MAG: hypothetical protein LBB46_00625 [Coriobacteriaceae bacterium]|jgi:hypothetical protein|nr:hypothetical protein [Coriobacteriaceae bacterium]